MPQRTKTRLKESNGFTLIEVMIALVIFTFGILAVLGLQVTSIKGNHTSFQFNNATNVAASMLETMAGLDYTHADFTAGSHGPVFGGNNNAYRMSWVVTQNTDNTKSVALSVNWTKDGNSRTINYDLIKGRDQ